MIAAIGDAAAKTFAAFHDGEAEGMLDPRSAGDRGRGSSEATANDAHMQWRPQHLVPSLRVARPDKGPAQIRPKPASMELMTARPWPRRQYERGDVRAQCRMKFFFALEIAKPEQRNRAHQSAESFIFPTFPVQACGAEAAGGQSNRPFNAENCHLALVDNCKNWDFAPSDWLHHAPHTDSRVGLSEARVG
jgi:hypothetical protein